jgi:predicted MFS family arabinose efflux permease
MKLKQVIYRVPFIIVWLSTLILLIYIGYGEAGRTYSRFQMAKLVTQGEIMQLAFASYLQAGLPLRQFSEFASQSEGLLRSDEKIENIQVLDPRRNGIFFKAQSDLSEEDLLKIIGKRNYRASKITPNVRSSSEYWIEESDISYRVLLALQGKFGTSGYVVIESKKSDILGDLNKAYRSVFVSFVGLSIVFMIFVLVFEIFVKNKNRRKVVYQAAYTIGFLIIAVVIGITVFNIYGEGARAKTKTLSGYIARRLEAIVELGIRFDDISGINEALKYSKSSNPDISAIAVIENDRSLFHTDEGMIGNFYIPESDSYEYVTPLKANTVSGREYKVAVSIPVYIVMQAILSSAKNFIVLFFACSLISLIFLDVSTQLVSSSDRMTNEAITPEEAVKPFRLRLSIIKPAYFMIVFVSALSVSFLPRLVLELLPSTTSPIASISLPFTIYYALFAIVLVPAGQYAERGSLKKLMGLGFAAEVVGLFLVATTDDYWILTAGRATSGIGQGLFLIGLQSYLLVVTPEDKRTQGASVKVIGRNSALIAGSAIGALLYAYMDYKRLFFIASVLSLVGLAYLLILVPRTQSVSPYIQSKGAKKERRSIKRLFKNIVLALKDWEFVKSLAFVGLVAKMSITGVVMFSMPLVMARMDFTKEDIGQAIMLYYIASMLVSRYASRLVDRLDTTKIFLFLSNIIGGIGMFVLGLVGVNQVVSSSVLPAVPLMSRLAITFNGMIGAGKLNALIIILCLALAGVSNGLMAAPILTHITKTKAAKRYGYKSMTATYVFLERIGHVLGPMVLSFLFFLSDQKNVAISFFGAVTILLGLLFVLTAKKSKS